MKEPMRRVFILSLLAAGIISCMACTSNDAPLSDNNGSGPSADALISKTKAYPSDYATEATHRGRVERIDYDTRDYAEGLVQHAPTPHTSICHTATTRIQRSVIMSSISFTDTTAQPPPLLRQRMDCSAKYSTTWWRMATWLRPSSCRQATTTVSPHLII